MAERDGKGQFVKGGKGGPGRPTRQVEIAKELAYLGIVLDSVTPDAWAKVVKKALEQAQAGDGRAREWLASFLVAESLEQVEKWRHEAGFFDRVSESVREKTVSRINGDD